MAEINSLIPILTCSDQEKVRGELEARLSVKRTGLDKECRALERIIDRLSGGEETVEIADKFYTPENALEFLRGFLQELKTLNAQIAEHGNTEELLKIVQEKYSELWVFALSFTIKSLPGVIDGLRRYPGTDDGC